MSIDAKRLAAALDNYKAADGVHTNRLSYVLERDDARRVAEAAKGVTADDAQRFYEVRDNEFQEGELLEAGTIGALADFLARRAGTSAGVTVTDDLVRVAQDALARYHFNIAFYAVKSALEAALAAAPVAAEKPPACQPLAWRTVLVGEHAVAELRAGRDVRDNDGAVVMVPASDLGEAVAAPAPHDSGPPPGSGAVNRSNGEGWIAAPAPDPSLAELAQESAEACRKAAGNSISGIGAFAFLSSAKTFDALASHFRAEAAQEPAAHAKVSQEAMDWATAQMPEIMAERADPNTKHKPFSELKAEIDRRKAAAPALAEACDHLSRDARAAEAMSTTPVYKAAWCSVAYDGEVRATHYYADAAQRERVREAARSARQRAERAIDLADKSAEENDAWQALAALAAALGDGVSAHFDAAKIETVDFPIVAGVVPWLRACSNRWGFGFEPNAKG